MTNMSERWKKMRKYIPNSGVMVDPQIIPRGSSLFNPKKLFVRYRSWANNVYCRWKIRKFFKAHDVRFKLAPWIQEAEQFYKEFCEARAKGDIKKLQDMSSEAYFQELQHTVITNPDLKREWKMDNVITNVEKLRVCSFNKQQKLVEGSAWAQLNVRFDSLQLLRVHDGAGNTLGGSEGQKEMREYLVLEKPLRKKYAFGWTAIGKLRPQ